MTEFFVIYSTITSLIAIVLLVGLVYFGTLLVKYLKIQLEVAEFKKEKFKHELDELRSKGAQ